MDFDDEIKRRHSIKVIGSFLVPMAYFCTFIWTFFKHFRNVKSKKFDWITMMLEVLTLIVICISVHRMVLSAVMFFFVGANLFLATTGYVSERYPAKKEFMLSSVGLITVMSITIINLYY